MEPICIVLWNNKLFLFAEVFIALMKDLRDTNKWLATHSHLEKPCRVIHRSSY